MADAETRPLLPPQSQTPRTRSIHWTRIWLGVTTLAAVVCACVFFFTPSDSPPEPPRPFSWLGLKPSSSLDWVDCFDRFKCARFEVPQDWSKPEGPKFALAVTKLPSRYSVDDSRYGGPIVYNPGGPGGSGNQFLMRNAELFQMVIGEQFDHLSFDPRGVGDTTPYFNLFPFEAEQRSWDAQESGLLNATGLGFGRDYAAAQIYGDLAARRLAELGHLVGTAAVARDVLAITKAHGTDRIRYWGGSYGSVLGATIATMFPGNIERLVIDAVMDTDTYYNTQWSQNLLSTDGALEYLFSGCAASPACPLHEPTIAGVRARYFRILDALRKRPQPFVASETSSDKYGIVDYGTVKGVVFAALYKPYRAFVPLAVALRDLENGDGRGIYEISGRDDSEWRCSCGGDQLTGGMREVQLAIACGDGDAVEDSIEELEDWSRRVQKTSSFADLLGMRVACSGWKLRTVEQLKGPYSANTSKPILIMNNQYDPVTPLASARVVAKNFPGSAVLVVATAGHGAIVTPSLCMAKHLKAYWTDGTLPPDETVCSVDRPIWPTNETESLRIAQSQTWSDEDRQLAAAVDQLSQTAELNGIFLNRR